ncbi:MAG: glycosyltransferase family 2 protein [Thermodesulfovibrionales bacterium]|nr:glycosyltransferase family 2 protein [Thermodesulfovibrionales bacterium]
MAINRICIIIPVHNRKHFTRECLLSLKKQTFQNFKVIVVDDGSTDGTGKMIEEEFPDVILLKGDGNLWWTGAINMGVEYALVRAEQDDYILTLNDDTMVRSDYLQTLLDSALKHPDSLIGSISVSNKDESVVVDAGVRINWLTAKYTNLAEGRGYNDILREDSLIHKVDVLPGRGTLIPVEVFKQVGLYDFKLLSHYGADYEFSRRANMNGYNLLINYEAVVISDVKMTGLNNRVNKLGWSDLIRSFFSIRSANNLKYRWNFARLCCAGWRFPVFYVCDVGRVIIGSLLYQTGLRNH